MDKSQKQTAALLAFIAGIYFLLFIPTSLIGAHNADMLSIFEIDEYAQYPNALHMVANAGSLYESIHNFAVYQHYFYGYPFYFFSGLVLLIGKTLLGNDWLGQTRLVVAVLRLTINVLPMLFAAGILTWIVTRFRDRIAAMITFLLLLILPGVVDNNFWWHPDSLAVLFLVLVYFFLDLDHFKFSKFWIMAAVACGVAFGLKYTGAFFVLAIPLYLYLGWRAKKITTGQVFKHGFLFVIAMFAAVIFSNPLLLLPQERPELIRYQLLQFSQTGQGIVTSSTLQETILKIGQNFSASFGGIPTALLCLAGFVLGVRNPAWRTHTLLVAAWSLPYLIVIFNVSNFRPHYLLPLVVPLLSLSAYLLQTAREKGIDRKLVTASAILIMAALFSNSLISQVNYAAQLNAEKDSKAIQFYQEASHVIAPIEALPGIRVYRDWQIYYPGQNDQTVSINWEKASFPVINDFDPDIILLDKRDVTLYADESILNQAANEGDVAANHAFYAAAAEKAIPGYSLIFEDAFGMAFVRDKLADQIHKPG